MLKDLFFNIWHNDLGYGWSLFVLALFFLCLIFLIIYFVLIKIKKVKFNNKHIIFLILIAITMYQAVPVLIDFKATLVLMFNIAKLDKIETSIDETTLNKLVETEKIAIKFSVIPWQKGGYYCKLANLYLYNHKYNKMFEAYETAYKYLKSYKCPCWGMGFLAFYNKRDYDAAIEIAKNRKKYTPNVFISQCYIMKGDMENAELYIDKAIQGRKNLYPGLLAQKAYILKIKGNNEEAIKYYQQAKQLCKKEKDIKKVDSMYNDFIEYENKRLHSIRELWGIEP